MSKRLHAMGAANYANGFKPAVHEHALDIPLHWKKPRRIFVNSMSDLFHPEVPVEFIQRVFRTMNEAHWHTYQILTKRSERLREISLKLSWNAHIWMGVHVEDSRYTYRINDLLATDANVRFLSIEPLLGPIPELRLTGIDWVIVGGESGPHCRPMQQEWVGGIRDQCSKADVPFFFKQWGGVHKKKKGRELEGRTWDELPILYQVA